MTTLSRDGASMTVAVPAATYDRRTIQLHWMTAALVATEWVVGRLTPLLHKGPLRLDIWSVHVLLGFGLALVLGLRVYWRLVAAPRRSFEGSERHRLAEVGHAGLYFLLFGVVILGVWNVFAHGFPLFGGWRFPKIGGEDYAKVVNGWHNLLANLIAAAAFLHAAAALVHRYLIRDDVLARMQWPSRRPTI